MEKIITWLASAKLIIGIAALVGKIPIPYRRLPIWIHGSKITANVFDRFVALILWKLGLLELFEHKLIQDLCRPGMQVVDIGANIGFHTVQMSKSVGPTGCVWAFEPSPGNFQMLQYNLAQNGCTNVIAEQVAVSAKTEKVMLFHSNIHHGDHRIYDPGMDRYDVLSIQAVALDDYFVAKRSIDFIKMDIQGAEGLALAGMRKLIQGSPDLVILMEFWPEGIQKTGCLPERILIDFINDGFKVFDLDEKHASLNEITHVHDFVQSFVGPGYRNLIISRKAPKLKLV